jgi:hypothetical protein
MHPGIPMLLRSRVQALSIAILEVCLLIAMITSFSQTPISNIGITIIGITVTGITVTTGIAELYIFGKTAVPIQPHVFQLSLFQPARRFGIIYLSFVPTQSGLRGHNALVLILNNGA